MANIDLSQYGMTVCLKKRQNRVSRALKKVR